MKTMKNNQTLSRWFVSLIALVILVGCASVRITSKEVTNVVPETFAKTLVEQDSITAANISRRAYFKDDLLIALIDSALMKNQELNIILQEIESSRSEVLEKKGEFLPTVRVGTAVGADKSGRYTRNGAVEHNMDIAPNLEFPEPLGDYVIGAKASWEIDIWRKLRNARDAAEFRYLAQEEGKNFLVTQLIAEIASAYYELLALDNQLEIINNNVIIQTDALKKVRLQKDNARATQLAVNRFEAQLLKTTNLQFEIRQRIITTENRLNFLTGRYPQAIARNPSFFLLSEVDSIRIGVPAQLLLNRPDIRRAENELQAANLDVKVARANFYPNLSISSDLGFQAFNPRFLLNPKSIAYNAFGDLMAPLINKKSIQAQYSMASACQIQAVYSYEQTLLIAYTEVLNELNKLDNYSKSLAVKSEEVEILNSSIQIANSLYQNARADYVEVLLTQEEVLNAKIELVEVKLNQLLAKVNMYRALGGGWQN